jgi:hypothetical protein
VGAKRRVGREFPCASPGWLAVASEGPPACFLLWDPGAFIACLGVEALQKSESLPFHRDRRWSFPFGRRHEVRSAGSDRVSCGTSRCCGTLRVAVTLACLVGWLGSASAAQPALQSRIAARDLRQLLDSTAKTCV